MRLLLDSVAFCHSILLVRRRIGLLFLVLSAKITIAWKHAAAFPGDSCIYPRLNQFLITILYNTFLSDESALFNNYVTARHQTVLSFLVHRRGNRRKLNDL